MEPLALLGFLLITKNFIRLTAALLEKRICASETNAFGLPGLPATDLVGREKMGGCACASTHICVRSPLKSAFYECSYSASLIQRFKFVRRKKVKYYVSKSSLNVNRYALMTFYSTVSRGSHLIFFLLNNIPF